MEKDNLPEREWAPAAVRFSGSFSGSHCWDHNTALARGLSLLTAHLAILWAPSRMAALRRESLSHYSTLGMGACASTDCFFLGLLPKLFFCSARGEREDWIFQSTKMYIWLQMPVSKRGPGKVCVCVGGGATQWPLLVLSVNRLEGTHHTLLSLTEPQFLYL